MQDVRRHSLSGSCKGREAVWAPPFTLCPQLSLVSPLFQPWWGHLSCGIILKPEFKEKGIKYFKRRRYELLKSQKWFVTALPTRSEKATEASDRISHQIALIERLRKVLSSGHCWIPTKWKLSKNIKIKNHSTAISQWYDNLLN